MERNSENDGINRRTYIQSAAVAGAFAGVGAVGVSPVSGQEQAIPNVDGEVAVTEFCGQFSPGPQIQQCIACVETRCDGEVNPLFPLFTGLSGKSFTPNTIPAGADFVTLKAGLNCYVAPVDDATTFSLPPGAPDISNATFYSCGGEPTPTLISFSVTCEQLTVTTENIDDGETLTATVTFLNAEGEESEQTFESTVDGGETVFELPGNLDPTTFVLSFGDLILDEQDIVAEDGPCTEDPHPPDPDDPRVDALSVTCEAITITTTDIEAGQTLFVTVDFVGDISTTYDVVVNADGVGVIGLPGTLDPSRIEIVFEDETLFESNIQAEDSPCAEVPPKPPEPPKEPKPPVDNKKDAKKRMKKHKTLYKEYKQQYNDFSS